MPSQTQLTGQILKELPRNAPAVPGSISKQKTASPFAVVINSLIAEYLAVCEMDVTLSTFQHENDLQGTRLSSAHILKLLNVKPGTCIGEALAIQGVHPRNPSGTSIGVEHARLCCSPSAEQCSYAVNNGVMPTSAGPHGLAVALLEAIAMTSLHGNKSKNQSMTKYRVCTCEAECFIKGIKQGIIL